MSREPSAALTDPASLFAVVGPATRVLVAVSGGPDSMALLHLAVRWRACGGALLHAATVDHGLRPDSRAEAEAVASWARALDVPHTILTWTGEKPTTRLQERAREERYRLLEGLAAEVGAEALLTGHHADDQAETILFRLLRGSGISGLAGMAPVSVRGRLRLVRPLLDLRKADLVAICEAAGQPFFQDPSNENPRFARTGLKVLIARLAEEGLGPSELLRLGRRAARAEETIAAHVAMVRSQLDAVSTQSSFEAEGAALAQVPREVLLRILEAEVLRLGDGAPRLDRLESLGAQVAGALANKTVFKGTLSGALVAVSQKGRFSITKAPPRRTQGEGA